jgi:hypothetical protein
LKPNRNEDVKGENMEQNYPVIDTGQNYPAQDTKPKHTGFGIAAFIISILSPTFFICSVITLYFLGRGAYPGTVVLVALFFGAFSFLNIGIGLGIAGLFQKNRRKIYAILGLVVSVLTILGLVVFLFLSSPRG